MKELVIYVKIKAQGVKKSKWIKALQFFLLQNHVKKDLFCFSKFLQVKTWEMSIKINFETW